MSMSDGLRRYYELCQCCGSDLLSVEGLRQIIERHGFISNNDVCGYSFFFSACENERFTEGIIQCLLEYFPEAPLLRFNCGQTPLHAACNNPNVTLGIIQLLVGSAPDSVRCMISGDLPLHRLCINGETDETAAMQILEFLLEKYAEAARKMNNKRKLPIHLASRERSPEFCRVLIEAYPGSERLTGGNSLLPLHFACVKGSLATVEYLYGIFPAAINHASTDELYPIHFAIASTTHRPNPAASLEIVEFLLDCDPNQKLKLWKGAPLLHFVCVMENNDSSNIGTSVEVLKVLFDAHPVAIEHNRIATDVQHYHPQMQAFINGELVYARQAKDHRLMNTPDEHGQLPLHRALQNNVRLGSIKLLVKGNPSAVRSVDDSGAFPLHVASEHHDCIRVVEYILGLSPHIIRDAIDSRENTTLHYACRGAKYDTIALLLEKYGAASVSKRNSHGKLPIDMLWESNEVGDRESVEYVGSVFQLLKAYPEIVMNFDTGAIQIQNETGKKRKYGSE